MKNCKVKSLMFFLSFFRVIYKISDFDMGPFKYYVSKIVGGWVWPNDYVCLHGGWVGLARCLRNKKNH